METLQEQKMMLQQENDEIEIDLKELFFMLLVNWKLILLAMLLGTALLGAWHTLRVTPAYEAEAELYIRTNTSDDKDTLTYSDLQISAGLTEDYAKIIKSRTVLNRVIENLDLGLTYAQLETMVTAENPDSTHIMEIRVVTDDPEKSCEIVNEVLQVSVDQISQIVGNNEPPVIDYAELEAVTDVTPSMAKYLVIGALLGIVAASALLVVRMLLSTSIKTEDDVEKYLNLPVLTAVPYYNTKRKEK